MQIELDTGAGRSAGFGLDLAASMPRVGSWSHVLGKLRPDDYRGAGAVEMMIDAIEEVGG